MDDHQLCNKTTHFVVVLCCRTKKQPTNTKINVQLSVTKIPVQMLNNLPIFIKHFIFATYLNHNSAMMMRSMCSTAEFF